MSVIGRLALPVTIFVTVAALSGGAPVSARSLLSDPSPIQTNTVAVTAFFEGGRSQRGFGVVVGFHKELLHIVTAKHVIYDIRYVKRGSLSIIDTLIAPVSVEVRFSDIPFKPVAAQIVEKAPSDHDFAFVTVKPPHNFDPRSLSLMAHTRMYQQGAPVWTTGQWAEGNPIWDDIDSAAHGKLEKADTLTPLIAGGLAVSEGKSGSPLFVDSGLAAIITHDIDGSRFQSYSIHGIREFAKRYPAYVNFTLSDYAWFSKAPKWYVGLGVGASVLTLRLKEGFKVSLEDGTPLAPPEEKTRACFGANFRFARGLPGDWLIGVDLDMTVLEVKSEDSLGEVHDLEYQYHNWSASLTYYLSPYFYIRGGPAAAVTWVVVDGASQASENGLGLTAGGGGQIRLGNRWWLVPSVSYSFQKFETCDLQFLNLVVGVIFTW